MLAVWANLNGDRARSIGGALALHAVAFTMLAIMQPKPSAAPPRVTSIELIEIPFVEIAAPEEELEETPEPEPDEDATPDEVSERVEQADILPDEEAAPAPEPETNEPEAAPELAIAAGVAVVSAGEVSQDEAAPEDEKIEIDPRYIIQYDPFSEAPPSAFARVGRAINCSRVNRATRPAFCPDYDDDDIAFAVLNRQRLLNTPGARIQYDPVYDIAGAQNVLERFAGRQRKAQPTGSSEIARVTHVERHPEGLKGCNSGPVLGLDGANAEPGGLPLGSTDGIFCN